MADTNIHNLRTVEARCESHQDTIWVRVTYINREGKSPDEALVWFLDDEHYAQALAAAINGASGPCSE